MANEKNLKPLNKRPKAERKEIASKGGKASVKVRAEKKTTGQLISLALSMGITEKNKDNIRKVIPDLPETDMTTEALMIAGQINSAAAGNTKAFDSLLAKKQEQEERERLKQQAAKEKTYHIDLDQIADVFYPVIRDIRNRGHLEYTLKGGRRSTKSSCFAMIIPELIRNNPDVHALILRKIGNTLKDSVYAKIKFHKNGAIITY